MSSTLHQLCQTPNVWTTPIEQIKNLWQPDDALLLLGPAAQGIFDRRLAYFTQLYVLQADLDALGITPANIQCKIINYDEWAQLVLSHQRHISWQ